MIGSQSRNPRRTSVLPHLHACRASAVSLPESGRCFCGLVVRPEPFCLSDTTMSGRYGQNPKAYSDLFALPDIADERAQKTGSTLPVLQ